MSPQKTILKNSLWNISSYFYLLVTALISLPLTLAGLGTEKYAHYLIVIAVCTIITSLDLGVPAALVRAVAGKESSRVFGSAFSLTLLGTVVVSLATYLVLSFLGGGMREVATVASLYTGLNYLLSHFAALPAGREDFAIASVRPFVAGTANTLMAATVAMVTSDLTQVLYVQVAGAGFALLLLLSYAIFHFGVKIIMPVWEKTALRSLLRFGLPVFAGNLAPQLQANLARVITAGSLSVQGLAGLGIAQSLVFKGVGIFPQIGGAIFPTAASLASKRSQIRRLALRVSLFFGTVSTILYLLFYFFGRGLLSWWLTGNDLAGSVFSLLIPYGLFVIVLSLTPIYSSVTAGVGKPGISATFAWIEVILELSLMFFLLPRYGVLAVPYAAVLAQLVVTPFFLYRARKALAS